MNELLGPAISMREFRSKVQPVKGLQDLSVNASLESALDYEGMRKNWFKASSLDEVEAYIDNVLVRIVSEQFPLSNEAADLEAGQDEDGKEVTILPEIDLLGIYERLADQMPTRISQEFADKVLQAITSKDSNLASRGARILTMTYMGSILSGARGYFTEDSEQNNDIVESAVVAVMDKALRSVKRFGEKGNISQQVYKTAQNGVAEFVAGELSMSTPWVRDREAYWAIRGIIDSENIASGREITSEEMGDIVERIYEKTEISRDVLREYILFINSKKNLEIGDDVVDKGRFANPEASLEAWHLQEQFERAFAGLSFREEKVLKLRYGLGKTLEEVGREFGVLGERARQIEAKALRKLRPSRGLKDFFTTAETDKLKRPKL